MQRPEERRHRRRQEGFTLIELGIVLAIIAILVAIAVPTYLNMVNRAHNAEAQQAWDMVKNEVWSSYLENNNTFPKIDTDTNWFTGLDKPKSTSDYWTYKAATDGTTAAGMEADHGTGSNATTLCWSIASDGTVSTGKTVQADGTCK